MAWFSDSLRGAIAAVASPFRNNVTALPGVNNFELAYRLYASSGLLAKVINIPAQDRVREWRDWQAEKPVIEALEAEERRLGLKAKVQEAEVLRGIGGGALILAAPGLPSEPIGLVAKGQLAAVNVVSRWQLQLVEVNQDMTSPTYGWPRMFRMQSAGAQPVDIHPSRVVCFRGEPLPSGAGVSAEERFWGSSRLLRVANEVGNSDNAQRWFAELVRKAKLLRIGISNLWDFTATDQGRQQLDSRVALIAEGENSLNATVYNLPAKNADGSSTGGEQIDDYQVSWAGIPAMMDAFDQRVSAVSDIPFTRLMGRSPAGMNATGAYDDQNWSKAVSAGQQLETRPCLEQLDPVLMASAGVADPAKVTWKWAPLWAPTEKEDAETFKVTMDAVKLLIESATIPEEAMARGVQNLMSEREWIPGLDQALALIPEAERFGLTPNDDGSDPSALAEGGDQNLDGDGRDGSVPVRRAANDALTEDKTGKAQPRVPAGSPAGGQFGSGGFSGGFGVNVSSKRGSGTSKTPASGGGGGGAAATGGKPAAKPAAKAATPAPAAKPAARSAGAPVSESKAHAAASATVTPGQKEALANYAGAGYRDVNGGLRSGKKLSRSDAKDVAEMDKVFSGARTTADIEVFRGVGADVAAKLKPGSSFVDKAFTSTSTSRDGAENFVRGDGAALMRIRVPKGSKAVSMMDHSVFSKAEKEVLLNRGGSYRVVSVTPGKGRKPAVIEVEYDG